ncbi:unnamed protein product [Cylindrotheca closterium]|uniref:DUF6824 domain-containing protein n=1 Tax=Cylindrotheca closterium TaxID=2856 RepID=A0AAD2CTF1_9STRA|nr:unnamed protein product [Cylindrotheca closterium]
MSQYLSNNNSDTRDESIQAARNAEANLLRTAFSTQLVEQSLLQQNMIARQAMSVGALFPFGSVGNKYQPQSQLYPQQYGGAINTMMSLSPSSLLEIRDGGMSNHKSAAAVVNPPHHQQRKATRVNNKTTSTSSNHHPRRTIQAKPTDIVCGRGFHIVNHRGNLNFHLIVNKYRKAYLESKRAQKTKIIKRVLEKVQKSGARFIRSFSDESTNCGLDTWEEVDYATAYKKVSHALRLRTKNETNRGFSAVEPSMGEADAFHCHGQNAGDGAASASTAGVKALPTTTTTSSIGTAATAPAPNCQVCV